MSAVEPVVLKKRVITGRADGPHLLITGGVHGDEFEPMAAIRRLMRAVDGRVLRGTLTLAPVVNEAAYHRESRCAEDGKDLARTCPGRSDGTITERIAFALSELIEAADFYIDLHTGGTTIDILPLVGYMMHPDSAVLEKHRMMAHAFNLAIVWGTASNLDGRSLSVARDAKVAAIYAEYGGGARCNPLGVDAYVDGCLNVMGMLGMIDRVQPPSRVEHFIEDERSGSGYLQVQNIAPMSGFFESRVKLGDYVQAGQVVGMMCDPLGERVEEVKVLQTGIVLTIKSFSHVREGDGVVVVLETHSGRKA